MMTRLVVLVALVGCSKSRNEKAIDAAELRAMLADRANNIETIRVDPNGDGTARYDITLKNTGVHSVATAEYPALIDAVFAARIMYIVGEREPGERVIDMTTLRTMLTDPANDIERIDVQPRDRERARYVLHRRGKPQAEVSYGEYPGHVIPEIQSSHIAYEIRP